ncbi:MAG: hypothetical protein U5K76_15600 [Woeseiaceae bacterium]|nr:hypothetical protein [Woeseiaceae bacterium]
MRDNNWIYDVFASWEESSGSSIQAGMLEPHVRESIDTLRIESGTATWSADWPRTALGLRFPDSA